MIFSKSYKTSFILATALHVFIVLFLLIDKTNNARPVLTKANKDISMNQSTDANNDKVIQAVNVDNKIVMEEINRLKEKQNLQKQAELKRQQKLSMEAEASRKKLIAEKNKVEALKKESERLLLAQKKKLAEENKRLEELAIRKKQEEKELAEMKNKQLKLKEQKELEAKKLADIKNKKAEELAKVERVKNEHDMAVKKQQEMAALQAAKKQQEIASLQAARAAAERSEMAGVVDKYKALIINAIGRQWILPENANSSMSSQFRIHLAPNGAVLDVSLIKSSGDDILDRSARAAIYKASPLPIPTDPKTFNMFRDISLTVRPGNARG